MWLSFFPSERTGRIPRCSEIYSRNYRSCTQNVSNTNPDE